ncbi:YggS family pyridoxal phosphate-dependent enzyme [Luteibaculum oceani]|uniref:Pyridoxal phosphate homeostasis protein n=1 Tax=Luteibaculum oceani TaxID=1294296 RepID=A0A5C6UXG6_9FLAO|nr:YggS family pyridoxal phosphate-dependent enzyme [Luteibaculum oceani]TXC76931.1 YggS family pyridoxal phosphate-dependent enzyme [Luteibaculum oceani]
MIQGNLKRLKKSLPQGVKLIAVSKKKPESAILEAYENGQLDFGENYVQELVDKAESLPKDIHWHFIGHLQRNKVKYIAPFVYLIHGVDSFKLLKEINKQAKKIDREISVLLQIHIAQEDSKFGFDDAEVIEMLNDPRFPDLEHIAIRGVMGMATNTNNTTQIEAEFNSLKDVFYHIRQHPALADHAVTEMSMGMTQDYQIAINCGSTMVRIGSAIFGSRK